MTRLRRWRERNAIEAPTLSVLLGMSVETLDEIETTGRAYDADKYALQILFDEISVGQLLSARLAEDAANEEMLLQRMDSAFRRTLLSWRSR